jgi:hypothetical protein
MSIRKGLKQYQERVDNSGPAVKWLKITPGATVRMRFLDDLDDSDLTSGAGIAAWVEEHTSPNNFRHKALCTREDEGHCYACEMASTNPRKGWARKERVYVNVLINNGVDDPYVAIWSMSTIKSPVFDLLKDTFLDEGSISNREFRVKRNGEGIDTRYVMRDLGEDASKFDFTEHERFDLEKIVRAVPYAEQEAFYGGVTTTESDDSDTSAEW